MSDNFDTVVICDVKGDSNLKNNNTTSGASNSWFSWVSDLLWNCPPSFPNDDTKTNESMCFNAVNDSKMSSVEHALHLPSLPFGYDPLKRHIIYFKGNFDKEEQKGFNWGDSIVTIPDLDLQLFYYLATKYPQPDGCFIEVPKYRPRRHDKVVSMNLPLSTFLSHFKVAPHENGEFKTISTFLELNENYQCMGQISNIDWWFENIYGLDEKVNIEIQSIIEKAILHYKHYYVDECDSNLPSVHQSVQLP